MALKFEPSNPMHRALEIQERAKSPAQLLTPSSAPLSQLPPQLVDVEAARRAHQARIIAEKFCAYCHQKIGARGYAFNADFPDELYHPRCLDQFAKPVTLPPARSPADFQPREPLPEVIRHIRGALALFALLSLSGCVGRADRAAEDRLRNGCKLPQSCPVPIDDPFAPAEIVPDMSEPVFKVEEFGPL